MTRLAAVLLAATLTLSGWACAPDEHVEVVPTPKPPARGTAEPVRVPESTRMVAAATPVPARVAAPSDPSNIERYILEVFGSAGPKALCIAALESTGQRGYYDTSARGKAGEISLFQIMPMHSWRLAEVGGTSLWNWKDNVRVAHHLYTSSGWRPWTVRNRC